MYCSGYEGIEKAPIQWRCSGADRVGCYALNHNLIYCVSGCVFARLHVVIKACTIRFSGIVV